MALKIRLRRMGRKKAPTYRIVVAESTMPRDGRFVANLGHYNPRTEPVTLVVDKPQVRQWLAKGAVPTETVAKLLERADLQNDEPTVVESAVEAVTETAKKAASAVAAAAGTVVETVVEAAQAAADQVREVVSGEEAPAEESPADEAPAEESAAADEAAAKVEADTTTAE
jgi:small subunit ribosomal protein S16